MALGVACGIVSIFYSYVFYNIRDRIFRRIKLPNHFKPAIGGLILGILILYVPEVLATGYGWIQLAIYGELALSMMIIILVAKIFATSFTISSGGSGGVFAPSIVIGSMLGGIFGRIFHMFFPSITTEPGAYVLIGMAAFFAGAAKAPIASMVMVSEMTGNYNLLVPLMLACSVSYVFTGRWTIYENQVLTRADSPAHSEEFRVDVLEQLEVGEVMTKEVNFVSPQDTVKEIPEIIKRTGHLGFPVIERGMLVGIVTYRDMIQVPQEEINKMRVRDIMSRKLLTTVPHEPLDRVLRKMNESGYGQLPVVDPSNPSKLVGIISKRDLIVGHEIARKSHFKN